MEMSNKMFIGAALTQMGIVCWYADDIYRTVSGNNKAKVLFKFHPQLPSRMFILYLFYIIFTTNGCLFCGV